MGGCGVGNAERIAVIDHDFSTPFGRVTLFVFLSGSLVSFFIEMGDALQVVLTFVLIVVGVLNGVNVCFNVIDKFKKWKNSKQ